MGVCLQLCNPCTRTVTVRINLSGGGFHSSKTGLKLGCPLSPTLFGLFADDLHRHVIAHCPDVGNDVDGGDKVSILGYADAFVLLADRAQGLQ